MGETEHRLRLTLNTRFRPSARVNYGFNVGVLFSYGGSFLFWDSYEKGYNILNNQVTNTQSNNMYIDPYVNIVSGAYKHSIRGRWMYISNDIQNADPTVNQDNQSHNFYTEYQVQRYFSEAKLTATGGLVASSNLSNSPLFMGTNKSRNMAAFLQLDKYLGKLFLNAGARYEYFNMNGKAESKPVLRAGANYELAKATFVRASYGQGYRFPAIAERYIQTSLGQLNIFPNPALRSETGWNAELGVKQGFSLGKINGFIDAAYFYTRYNDMIDFNFGYWHTGPDFTKNLGFKTVNIGQTQITGFDVSINAEGKAGNVLLQGVLGYTYTNPVMLNPDYVFATDTSHVQWSFRNTRSDSNNTLKYRYKHLAKLDLQASWKKWQLGTSVRYNSYMENVDWAFVGLPFLKGVQQGRDANKKGNVVVDMRMSFMATSHLKLSVAVNNVFNAEVMTRPADLRPPRWALAQVGVVF